MWGFLFIVMMKYTILGERCSGTKFLENLVSINFEIDIQWEGIGWKHFFNFDGYESRIMSNSQLLYIGIVRNPIDYLISFYNNPHHQSVDRTVDMRTFLLGEFYSIWRNPDIEIMEDRRIDGVRYSNIFEMRSYKCRFLLDRMVNIADKYEMVRYEDLKNEPQQFLEYIESKYKLRRRNDDFIINSSRIESVTDINEYGQASYATSSIQLRENYDVKGEVMDIIMSHIDKDTENRMSYLL